MVRKKSANDKTETRESGAAEELARTAAGALPEAGERVYTKSRLTASKRFRAHRDLLQAVLEDSGEYTLRQAEDAIRNFSERKAGN